MKKILLVFLLVLLSFSATSFSTSLDNVKQEANETSPAQFQLVIDNPSSQNHSYSISLLSPKSSWFYYPGSITVNANSNETVNVSVSPVEKAIQQRYRFDMKIREQSTGEIEDRTGFFQVNQPYKLHIIELTQDKQTVTPGEVINSEIEIQNLHNTPVSNYEIKAEYKNNSKTDSGTEILPGGTRRYEFSFRTNKNALPATQSINYTLTADGKLQNTARQKIEIKSIQNISRTEKTENKILTIGKTVSAENTGNSPSNTSLTVEIPSYLTSITSTTPQPAKIEEIDSQTIYTWKTNLDAGESFEASYTTNYWIPLAGTLLLAVGAMAIKLIGRDVEIRKTAQKDSEKIKINLELENTGEKSFDKLEIEEFIPDIATVDEGFSMNTPKVRKTSEGTRLTWKIEDFQPGDQRIIQYQIKPKVDVEEEVEFQRCKIKNMNGTTLAKSNTTKSKFNTT